MGFAFLPLGIGSLIGGAFGGFLIHHFGEVRQNPSGMWWVIVGVGVLVAKKESLKYALPFGTFLALGAALAAWRQVAEQLPQRGAGLRAFGFPSRP